MTAAANSSPKQWTLAAFAGISAALSFNTSHYTNASHSPTPLNTSTDVVLPGSHHYGGIAPQNFRETYFVNLLHHLYSCTVTGRLREASIFADEKSLFQILENTTRARFAQVFSNKGKQPAFGGAWSTWYSWVWFCWHRHLMWCLWILGNAS